MTESKSTDSNLNTNGSNTTDSSEDISLKNVT